MPVEENLMQAILLTFGTAMVPVLELRGAIPVGVAAGLSPAAACLVSILGNMVPVPFILLLIRRIFDWLRGTRLFGPRIDWLERRAHLKGRMVRKYRLPGLIILVAIPLPGTGAWTGALVAALLDIRMRHALPAIFLGVVIAGAIVAFFYTRHKKIKMGAMTDLAVMGLLLGQCIGRWANFINREAFGAETTLPWRMRLWTSATEYIEVHPTFFYESLWNLIGLLLILLVVSKARRFDGENTWFYFLWYGLGRFWIEGLRTDSLYLFNWTFLGQPIRVSQALSLLLAVTAAVMLFYNIKIKKHSRDELLVNQVAAEAAEGTAEADISTAEAGESVAAGQEEPEFPQPPETQNGEGGRD